MKQIITKEEVGKAILDLASQGKKPTLAAVHAALNNRGSMSTLVRLKAEIEAAAQPVTDSPEGLKAFREVWALAVDEGRKQQEAVLVELRESVKALATENERLEGTALAAQNHAAEIEQAKSRAETELSRVKTHIEGEMKQAKTDLAEATTQAAGALQKLAESQAAHATQVAALQADLTTAVRKAHELELQFVRAEALLEAKGIQPATAESQKPKHTKETRDQP
jgi:chromosome segregation ATPase